MGLKSSNAGLSKPNQSTKFVFPTRSFGNRTKKLSFQANWFENFKWVHYDEALDAAYCFTCMKAEELKLVTSTKS